MFVKPSTFWICLVILWRGWIIYYQYYYSWYTFVILRQMKTCQYKFYSEVRLLGWIDISLTLRIDIYLELVSKCQTYMLLPRLIPKRQILSNGVNLHGIIEEHLLQKARWMIGRGSIRDKSIVHHAPALWNPQFKVSNNTISIFEPEKSIKTVVIYGC